METDGYSPAEVSPDEAMPEIVEATPESSEALPLGETAESEDLVPEPEEFPPWTPETETGPARDKESLPEKQGDLIKPTGDPRDTAATEDQALDEEEPEKIEAIEETASFGKVLTNDDEPGKSTHLHWHKDGLTISTKDQNTGTVERFEFGTGRHWEMNPDTPMPDQKRESKLRAEVPDYNPNPDAGTIEGFHSGVYGVAEHEDAEDEEN